MASEEELIEVMVVVGEEEALESRFPSPLHIPERAASFG